MGKHFISRGVYPRRNRIMFDLLIDGSRFRPTLPWPPTELNLRRAHERMTLHKLQIAAGTFSFAEAFPDYHGRRRSDVPTRTLSCSDVFDRFLKHCEARVARDDLAPCTVSSYRQILDHTWRPRLGPLPFLGVRYSTLAAIADAQSVTKKTYNNLVSAVRRAFEYGYRDRPEQRDPSAFLKCIRLRRRDRPAIDPFCINDAEALIAEIHRQWGEAQGNFDEFRFFTGLRPSEQIALLVSDFDSAMGSVAVTKARVRRVDRNTTKTGESREIHLCPRARAILERQLLLRERLTLVGRIDHDHLFFDGDGRFFLDNKNTYRRWAKTLRRLPIRYRKPYVARHSAVSWNLMMGRNPVLLAGQYGHSVVTMLNVYAAWTQDTANEDVSAIRQAHHPC